VSGAKDVVLGASPRVDLLPVQVRDRHRAKRLRRRMIGLVAASVVVVGLGSGAAAASVAAAQMRLQAEQSRTADLLAAQLQYADVTQVDRRISAIGVARQRATTTEVQWRGVLDAIRQVMPGDAVFAQVAFTGVLPWQTGSETPDGGPLQTASVGSVAMTIATPGAPDATGWVRAIRELPAVSDVMLTGYRAEESGYSVDIVVYIDAAGLSGRFAPAEADADADAEPASDDTTEAGE